MTFLLHVVLTRPSLRCEQRIAAVPALGSEPRDAVSGLNPSGMCTASWEIRAGTVPPTLALVMALSPPPILPWAAQV